jgi:hypothetical protein
METYTVKMKIERGRERKREYQIRKMAKFDTNYKKRNVNIDVSINNESISQSNQ